MISHGARSCAPSTNPTLSDDISTAIEQITTGRWTPERGSLAAWLAAPPQSGAPSWWARIELRPFAKAMLDCDGLWWAESLASTLDEIRPAELDYALRAWHAHLGEVV